MKTLTLTITIFFFIHFLSNAQNIQKKINCNYNKTPFNVFCNSILEQSGVKIYYFEEWVTGIEISLNKDSITVFDAVQTVLQNTNLKVSAWENNLVLLPGEFLINKLPDYKISKQIHRPDTAQKIVSEKENIFLKGRKTDSANIYYVGKKELQNLQSKVKISIRVVDKENGDPVTGATAFVKEISFGAVSNSSGFLTLVIPPGKYTVNLEFLGMEKKQITLFAYSSGEIIVPMVKNLIEINEVQVYADYQKDMKLKEAGIEKLTAKEIKEIPTMLGERDLLKFSQMFPGIVSVGENTSGLNVRGGNADQNGFYINKIPVFNTSHLFGFFTAFNSEIVKDFSIYKGYIPAQYGGNLSSIFNVVTRNGNRRNFRLHGGITPISSNVVIEGPIIRDTFSYLVSARTSYSDWILKKVPDQNIRNSKAGFNDFSLSLNYDKAKNQFSVFLYNSNDRFKFSEMNDYEYSNLGGVFDFKRNLTNFLQMNIAMIYSQYSFNTIDKSDKEMAYEHFFRINQNEMRIDFKHFLNFNNSLEYGADFVDYRLNRGILKPWGDVSVRGTQNYGKEKGIESSVYFSDEITLSPSVTLTLGGRYSLFAPMGEKKVFIYLSEFEKSDNSISDSVFFGRNKPLKWYHSPELRALLNISLNKNSSLKISFNQTHQNLFMLNNTLAIAPNTQWKLADYYLKPSLSKQYSVGYFRNFNNGWETSCELFFKQTKNYTEFKDGADFLSNKQIEQIVLQGKHTAYGAELMIKRSRKRLNGWISYTYSHAFVQVKNKLPEDNINDGEIYPASYDIPHVVNALINYRFKRRVNLSTIFVYQTGKPITFPVSYIYMNGEQYAQYSKRNEYRIPDYFRVDASLTIEGNLLREKLFHSSWMFSVYNLSGRRNPFSVFFKMDNRMIYTYKYSIIGAPVFTITWLVKLGNYATE